MGKKINTIKKIHKIINISSNIIEAIPEASINIVTDRINVLNEKRNEKRKDNEVISQKKDEIREAEKQITTLKSEINLKNGDKLKLEKELKYCNDQTKCAELETQLLDIQKDLEYCEERKIQWEEHKKALEESL